MTQLSRDALSTVAPASFGCNLPGETGRHDLGYVLSFGMPTLTLARQTAIACRSVGVGYRGCRACQCRARPKAKRKHATRVSECGICVGIAKAWRPMPHFGDVVAQPRGTRHPRARSPCNPHEARTPPTDVAESRREHKLCVPNRPGEPNLAHLRASQLRIQARPMRGCGGTPCEALVALEASQDHPQTTMPLRRNSI